MLDIILVPMGREEAKEGIQRDVTQEHYRETCGAQQKDIGYAAWVKHKTTTEQCELLES